MKKLQLIVASLLATGMVFGAAGCNNYTGPDPKSERNYKTEYNGDKPETPEKDKDCKNGDCENLNLQESIPEFKFRPHKPYNPKDDNNLNEKNDNDDNNEDPVPEKFKTVRPHRKRPHKNDPSPTPMPVKPRK